MNRLAITVAALAMFSTAALAEDFDNTGLNVSLQGDVIGVEIGTQDSELRSVKLTANSLPIGLGLKAITNDGVRDYEISLDKRFSSPISGDAATGVTSLYVNPELVIATGDSYADEKLSFTSALGIESDIGFAKPYIEGGYTFATTSADWFDIGRDASYAKIGAVAPITDRINLDLSVTRSMDKDFNNADHEALVKVVFNF